jgi:hypothetical protein
MAIGGYRQDWEGRLPPYYRAGATVQHLGSWDVLRCTDQRNDVLRLADGDVRTTPYAQTHSTGYVLQFTSGPPSVSEEDQTNWIGWAYRGDDFGVVWDNEHWSAGTLSALILRMDGRVDVRRYPPGQSHSMLWD